MLNVIVTLCSTFTTLALPYNTKTPPPKKEGRGVCSTLRTNRAKLAWPALLPNDE